MVEQDAKPGRWKATYRDDDGRPAVMVVEAASAADAMGAVWDARGQCSVMVRRLPK